MNDANTLLINEVASICALNRDNPAKKAQPTHDCFLQNLIAFHFNKATNPPNPKSLLLRAYILCTTNEKASSSVKNVYTVIFRYLIKVVMTYFHQITISNSCTILNCGLLF